VRQYGSFKPSSSASELDRDREAERERDGQRGGRTSDREGDGGQLPRRCWHRRRHRHVDEDLSLGLSVFVELRHQGVDVLVLEPGPVQTEFQDAASEISHGGEPAENVVAAALQSLGGPPSVIPGWFNWLRANVAGRLGPRPLTAYVARTFMESRTPDEMR